MEANQSSATPNELPMTNTVPVIFSGKGGEFFGIWIVNILLSIVTLGIYSAWAKVRTQQYFFANTNVDGHRFSYLANPIQILKGRILAIILFIAYSLVVSFFPIAGLGFVLIMFLLSPWLINQSMRFNLRMTSYRNVRFSFAGSYGEAFLYFIILPILSLFTLYLAMPWALKKMDEYLCNNISYGDKTLTTNIETSQYYITCLFVVLFSLIAGVIVVAVLAFTGQLGSFESVESGSISVGMIISMVAYLAIFNAVAAIYQARIRNHIFNNSEFEALAKFKSNVSISSYAVLLLVNMIAVIGTLGFAYPWVKIRTAAFLARATEVELQQNSDTIFDTMEEKKSSFGEEAAEIFDVDIAII